MRVRGCAPVISLIVSILCKLISSNHRELPSRVLLRQHHCDPAVCSISSPNPATFFFFFSKRPAAILPKLSMALSLLGHDRILLRCLKCLLLRFLSRLGWWWRVEGKVEGKLWLSLRVGATLLWCRNTRMSSRCPRCLDLVSPLLFLASFHRSFFPL
jgi:hypothetical protein